MGAMKIRDLEWVIADAGASGDLAYVGVAGMAARLTIMDLGSRVQVGIELDEEAASFHFAEDPEVGDSVLVGRYFGSRRLVYSATREIPASIPRALPDFDELDDSDAMIDEAIREYWAANRELGAYTNRILDEAQALGERLGLVIAPDPIWYGLARDILSEPEKLGSRGASRAPRLVGSRIRYEYKLSL